MSIFAAWRFGIGSWVGKNRLHYPPEEQPQESASQLTVMQDRDDEIRLGYTWEYQGKLQTGVLALWDQGVAPMRARWNDTWHTGDTPMEFTEADETGYVSLLGSYPAPPGPDWGWRIELEPGEPFTIRMFNITPDGIESIAVEATYTRQSGNK